MERYIKEIEAIERDIDVELDRECIGLYNVTVVFLDTGEEFRLIDDYFEKKKSCFDPYWAGCYITPGEVTTLRKIIIHALQCAAKSSLIREYFGRDYRKNGVPEEKAQWYKTFVPKLVE